MAATEGPYAYDPESHYIVSTTAFAEPLDDDEQPAPLRVACLLSAMGGEDSEADTRLLVASWEMHDILQEVLPVLRTIARPNSRLLARVEAILNQVEGK